MNYEKVIGLEVHVELKTKSKIFCSCDTAFGNEPNTQCCPVCAGLPGVLPVLNKKAVELALKAGIVTNCDISKRSVFDRKNYFYPDLPKAYQISQLYYPLCTNGFVNIKTGNKKIRIREIHLEEDAGKLIHDEFGQDTMIDFNRCGVPLIEIVTMPDFNTSDEVYEFLELLKAMLQYADISDCKMQEGSLRADVNISIKEKEASKLGTRTEMKNLNSFKAIKRAIDSETARQINEIQNGRDIIQETRRWDDEKNTSYSMRSKEEAHDYRYFPEPDLPIIQIDESWLAKLRQSIPEMPKIKEARYIKEYMLPEYDSSVLTSSRALSEFLDAAVLEGGDPKMLSNWLMGDYMKLFNSTNKDECFFNFKPKDLVRLTKMVNKEEITGKIAKDIFAVMFKTGQDPEEIIKRHNISVVSDRDELFEVVKKVIDNNQKSVNDYLNGKEKAIGFFIGQVMKETKGRADPKLVKEIAVKILLKEGNRK